jgi:hypothetical protein
MTAVEWYKKEVVELAIRLQHQKIDLYEFLVEIQNLEEQAKEMEKQIIDAWNIRAKIDGVLTHTDNRTAEQYYKETFKSE